MKKRLLSMLLALALLVCAVPFAAAENTEDHWYVYWDLTDETTLAFCIVPPDYYVEASPDAAVEYTIGDNSVSTTMNVPLQGETVSYYRNLSVTSRLMLWGKVPITKEQYHMHVKWNIPANIALRADGSGNPAHPPLRYGENGFDGLSLRAWSNLTQTEFEPDSDHPVAVGDMIRITWESVLPAEIYRDGELLTTLCAGEGMSYQNTEEEPGDHVLTAVCNGRTISKISYRVISPQQAYRDNLKHALGGFGTLALLPIGTISIPLVNAFVPMIMPVAIVHVFVDFVKALFAFTHITH